MNDHFPWSEKMAGYRSIPNTVGAMDELPYRPPRVADDQRRDGRRGSAFRFFIGIWLLGLAVWLLRTCVTGVFVLHGDDSSRAFASRVVIVGTPVVIAVYSSVLAAVWLAIPRFRTAYLNELLFAGAVIVGGVLAPDALMVVAHMFRGSFAG